MKSLFVFCLQNKLLHSCMPSDDDDDEEQKFVCICFFCLSRQSNKPCGEEKRKILISFSFQLTFFLVRFPAKSEMLQSFSAQWILAVSRRIQVCSRLLSRRIFLRLREKLSSLAFHPFLCWFVFILLRGIFWCVNFNDVSRDEGKDRETRLTAIFV